MGRVIQRTKRKEKIFQHFLVHKVLQDSDLQLNLLAEEDSIMTLEALTEVSEAVAVEEAVEADEDVVVDLEETGTMVMVMKVLTSHPENEKKGENFPAFPGSQGPPDMGFGRGGRGRRGGFGGNWNDGHGDESFDESSRERKERRKFSSISWFTRSSRIRTSSSTFWPRRIQ